MNNQNEKIKNSILLEMKNHLDHNSLLILENVLNKEFQNVEITELKYLPANTDDINRKIIEMFNYLKAPKLSPKTVNFYMETIERLICHCNKPLTKVTSIDIESFLASIKSQNSPTSLNNQRRNISAFFTWMRKNHLIIENPCESIEPYVQIKKPVDHMNPEDYEQLKSGCKTLRDRALIEFLRSTAIRVGESQRIKVSDINWNTGKLIVYGEKGRAYRPVFLDCIALKYVKDYINDRGVHTSSGEPLFVPYKNNKIKKPLSNGTIRKNLNDIANRSQVNRNIYPHLFRKTTANSICARGGSVHDAGEYLGHKDKSVAGQYYVGTSEEHTYNIFNKYVAIK